MSFSSDTNDLVKYISDGNNSEAKRVIDEIASIEPSKHQLFFQSPNINSERNFNNYPLMAALYYGNEELFMHMVNRFSSLELHKSVSASHPLINIAVNPCSDSEAKIDENKLSNAHKILNYLDKKLSWEDKKACNFLSLAIFFLNTELVKNLEQNPQFHEIANETIARDAKPINLALGLHHDPRGKEIFELLNANHEIQQGLKGNDNYCCLLLDAQLFQEFLQAVESGWISENQLASNATLNALLNGFTRLSDPTNEYDLELIERVSGLIINSQKDTAVLPIFISSQLNRWSIDIQNIIIKDTLNALKEFIKSDKLSFTALNLEGCDVMCEIIANSDDLKSFLTDLNLTQEDKDLLFDNDPDNLTHSKIVAGQKGKLATFADEVNNTTEHFYKTLNRPSEKSVPFNNFSNEDEAKRSELMQRIFLTLGSSGMELKKPGTSDEWIPAQENNLPLAVEFGVGPRVLLEIPQTSDLQQQHQFFNWLTSGTLNGQSHINPSVTERMSGNAAREENKIVYTRPAATHGIDFYDNSKHVKEVKTGAIYQGGRALLIGLQHYLGYGSQEFFTGHFGMDVGVGGYGEIDIHGKTIRPDGATGHLYMHYYPPTTSTPGAILVGMEGCAPGVDGQYGKHSLVGASDDLTVSGGRQSKELAKMKCNTGSFIADRYDARRVRLTNEKMQELYSLDLKSIENPAIMACATAKGSVEEFVGSLKQIAKPNYPFIKSNIFSFETLCSPKHADFVPSELKRRLAEVILELSAEHSSGNKDIRNKYTKIIREVFALNEMTNARIEEFRKSVEVHLGGLGRNSRYQLAYDVHVQVCKERKIFEDNIAPEMYGITENRIARLHNQAHKTFYNPEPEILVQDKKASESITHESSDQRPSIFIDYESLDESIAEPSAPEQDIPTFDESELKIIVKDTEVSKPITHESSDQKSSSFIDCESLDESITEPSTHKQDAQAIDEIVAQSDIENAPEPAAPEKDSKENDKPELNNFFNSFSFNLFGKDIYKSTTTLGVGMLAISCIGIAAALYFKPRASREMLSSLCNKLRNFCSL